MEWAAYIPVAVIAMAIFSSAVYALYWALKHHQFKELARGADVIFDDEEPIGQPTDFYPGQRPKPVSPAAETNPTKTTR